MVATAIRVGLATAMLAGIGYRASAAVAGPGISGDSRLRQGLNARPFANSTTYYAFGDSIASIQWRLWFGGFQAKTAGDTGCYATSGTGEAQSAFLTSTSMETVTSPQIADCVSPNTGLIRYPETDFAAGDAPLSIAQNSAYNSSRLSTRGPAIVLPVAGAAVSEAYNTNGLPAGLTISNAQLCGIWKGTITNWTGVTNQATGQPASPVSLPISIVYRTDGGGSTFIHTAHLNAVCSGGYGPVGTTFPTGAAGHANLLPAIGDGGVGAAIAANRGAIGYAAPRVLASGEASAAIENASGQYEFPNAGSIATAFTSPTTAPPTGYPGSGGSEIDLYQTNPSASGSYAEVGYTYAFGYTCYPTTSGASAAEIKSLFDNEVYAVAPTQTGLVNLPSKSGEIVVIERIKAGSAYNTLQGCR